MPQTAKINFDDTAHQRNHFAVGIAVFELTAVATFELVELAFAATALILALVFAFDPRALESSPEQPANPKTVKHNKIAAEKKFHIYSLLFIKIK